MGKENNFLQGIIVRSELCRKIIQLILVSMFLNDTNSYFIFGIVTNIHTYFKAKTTYKLCSILRLNYIFTRKYKKFL